MDSAKMSYQIMVLLLSAYNYELDVSSINVVKQHVEMILTSILLV